MTLRAALPALPSRAASLALAATVAVGLAGPVSPVLAEALPLPPATQATTDDAAAAITALGDLMLIPGVIAVMRDEGIDYGRTLSEEMFDGEGGPGWEAAISAIYDPERMRRTFDAALIEALAGDTAAVAATTEFFGTERGATILSLELEARRALLDEAVEEAAMIAVQELQEKGDPRYDRLVRFAEANDLIEANVMGALNANLAFYKGIVAAGAFPGGMPEDEMLAEVWAQEDSVRAETESWLYPFIGLAYQPLSDEDLDAYIAFSESPEGQRLNRALFVAFDALFVEVSTALGRETGRRIGGQDI